MALIVPVSSVKKSVLRQRKTKILRGQRPAANGWIPFYRELKALIVDPLFEEIERVMPFLLSRPPVAAVQAALFQVQETYRKILGPSIPGIAARWVGTVSEQSRRKLEASLGKAIGVDYTAIVDSPFVNATIHAMSEEAIQLIRTIPSRYLLSVQDVIMKSYMQERLPEDRPLAQEIKFIGHTTYERAKVIARDQTHKIHSAVEQERQTDIGIEEYIWRTAEDQRVVGAPGGLYPKPTKLHGNHYVRNGKKFRWDSPPPDGAPGWPIQCRCYAEPIINIDKIIAKSSHV